MTETIFITGILGQDGAYLARHALELGHRVVGGARRNPTSSAWRLRELGIETEVEIVDFDLLDDASIRSTIEAVRPDRVFNLAAQSFVGLSFEQPVATTSVDAMGVLRLLEAIRTIDREIRFYQASTSEMFGAARHVPHSEATPFHPRSPYAVAKAFGHYITQNYREAHGLRATSGILFNHESPLRGEEFVTRKITSTLARIAAGSDEVLALGNLDASRDWGHARDYVRGMWMMTDQSVPTDFILATGVTTTVREFVALAARQLDMPLAFSGSGLTEQAHDATGRPVVQVDPRYFRPVDLDRVVGDASKARRLLGWVPEVDLPALVADMVAADQRRARSDRL